MLAGQVLSSTAALATHRAANLATLNVAILYFSRSYLDLHLRFYCREFLSRMERNKRCSYLCAGALRESCWLATRILVTKGVEVTCCRLTRLASHCPSARHCTSWLIERSFCSCQST